MERRVNTFEETSKQNTHLSEPQGFARGMAQALGRKKSGIAATSDRRYEKSL